MSEDTIKLLKECDAGCKMATDSIAQVEKYAEKEALKKLLDQYQKKHEKLKEEITEQLQKFQKEEQEPDKLASAFAWITTEMKLLMKDNSHQIAKIMMDGCNMGIQSVSEYLNQYPQASQESKSLAKKLVETEEMFMKELKKFL
ncbi:hypothetical protein DXB23_05055 [Dorea sp. OM02-2LB]|jgi:hypothetical protein|nr:hypothetical protein DXB23_05055 [Dorea sp. OM02-2LB]